MELKCSMDNYGWFDQGFDLDLNSLVRLKIRVQNPKKLGILAKSLCKLQDIILAKSLCKLQDIILAKSLCKLQDIIWAKSLGKLQLRIWAKSLDTNELKGAASPEKILGFCDPHKFKNPMVLERKNSIFSPAAS